MLIANLKRYFIAGLLFWIPLALTFFLLKFFIETIDSMVLPTFLENFEVKGYRVPGIGVLILVVIIFITGLFIANVIGNKLVVIGESFLARIPIVSSLYKSVKQISDTLIEGNNGAFRKVLLVRFPHENSWSLAFQTSLPSVDITEKTGSEMLGVFIPTAPSPVNGFFFFVSKDDVIEMPYSIENTLKYIVSMGVAQPATLKEPPKES